MVLKCEYLVDLFLETAQLVWSKVDIDEGRKEAVRSILGLAPGPVVSSKISIKMQSSIWAAAATDTVAFDQAIEWPQIMLLADLSQYVNQDHGLASAANLWDLIWIYCMLAGLGSEEDASKLGHSVHASFCALQTSASHEYQAELDVLLEDWKRLQALQQVDVMEQLQDGYISQVPTLMHKVISEIVQAGLALAPSDGECLYRL